MEVFGRGLEIAVAEQHLDAAQVDRVFQQMGGEAMPQSMG